MAEPAPPRPSRPGRMHRLRPVQLILGVVCLLVAYWSLGQSLPMPMSAAPRVLAVVALGLLAAVVLISSRRARKR